MLGSKVGKAYCKKHGFIDKLVDTNDEVAYCYKCYVEAERKKKRDRVLFVRTSQGNKTIGDDTYIINICSATDCPSKKLGFCKIPKECYAMKAERLYPTCLPYRRRQTKIWDMNSGEEIALQLVARARSSNKEIKFVRFSEAGDFRDQSDVDKMSEVGRVLGRFGIGLYGYTAREDLDFSKCDKNMVVNGSGFMIHNAFTAVKKEEVEQGEWVCKQDCRVCDKCKERNGLWVRDSIK